MAKVLKQRLADYRAAESRERWRYSAEHADWPEHALEQALAILRAQLFEQFAFGGKYLVKDSHLVGEGNKAREVQTVYAVCESLVRANRECGKLIAAGIAPPHVQIHYVDDPYAEGEQDARLRFLSETQSE